MIDIKWQLELERRRPLYAGEITVGLKPNNHLRPLTLAFRSMWNRSLERRKDMARFRMAGLNTFNDFCPRTVAFVWT